MAKNNLKHQNFKNMSNEKKKNIKMNLTLKADFYETLQELAERDHLKVSTWTKQFLMRQIEEQLKYEELMPGDCPF